MPGRELGRRDALLALLARCTCHLLAGEGARRVALRVLRNWGHYGGSRSRARARVIGREALLRNKRAAGRHKDLDDVEWLERFT